MNNSSKHPAQVLLAIFLVIDTLMVLIENYNSYKKEPSMKNWFFFSVNAKKSKEKERLSMTTTITNLHQFKNLFEVILRHRLLMPVHQNPFKSMSWLFWLTLTGLPFYCTSTRAVGLFFQLRKKMESDLFNFLSEM